MARLLYAKDDLAVSTRGQKNLRLEISVGDCDTTISREEADELVRTLAATFGGQVHMIPVARRPCFDCDREVPTIVCVEPRGHRWLCTRCAGERYGHEVVMSAFSVAQGERSRG